MDIALNGLIVVLSSYLICRISKNKIVNFVFGSIMSLSVIGLFFTPPSSSADPAIVDFLIFVGLGFSFLTGYAISKATT